MLPIENTLTRVLKAVTSTTISQNDAYRGYLRSLGLLLAAMFSVRVEPNEINTRANDLAYYLCSAFSIADVESVDLKTASAHLDSCNIQDLLPITIREAFYPETDRNQENVNQLGILYCALRLIENRPGDLS